MRSVFTALLAVLVLSAGPAFAQSMGDNLDWDPAQRDFRKPGGAPSASNTGSATMATLDKELARTDLAPQKRADLLLLRSLLNRTMGRETDARRDLEQALKSVGDLDVAAETDPVAKRTNGRCLTALFQGLDTLRIGNRNRARELFQLSQARCGPNTPANLAAAAELRRM
jgi:hypothetical protein